MLTTEDTESTERATPETDAAVTTFTSISKLKRRFECSTGKVSADFARRLERERDEARDAAAKWESSFDAMERAGAEQARRADENREWALRAERERDEARALVDRLHVAFEGRCRATYEWYSTDASDVREAALRFLYPEQFK